jgi:hypothetical protein
LLLCLWCPQCMCRHCCAGNHKRGPGHFLARVWGCAPISQFLFLPQSWGRKGVENSPRRLAAGFTSLYPPYWISADAGMAKESVRLRRTEGRGVPEISLLSSSMIGGQMGLKPDHIQAWTPATSPSCCKNGDCMLYIRRTATRSIEHAVTECGASQQWGENDI